MSTPVNSGDVSDSVNKMLALTGEGAIDFVANASSLGAHAVRARTIAELRSALAYAKSATETTVIVIESDPLIGVPSYESWWEVVPAEISEQDGVRAARQDWSANKKRQRRHI